MVLIIGYMEQHHVHNTIKLHSGHIKSWVQLKLQSCMPHFHHQLKSATFSLSKYNKQRGLTKYQLHMEEAKRGIYLIGNSLLERCWIGHISIRKGKQNSTFESIKANLIGLKFQKLLDYSVHVQWITVKRHDVPAKMMLLQSYHDIKTTVSGELW